VNIDVDADDKVQITFDENPSPPRSPNPETIEVD
jgi:ATP-dependent Clp protease ATP-binding subunit ClpA